MQAQLYEHSLTLYIKHPTPHIATILKQACIKLSEKILHVSCAFYTDENTTNILQTGVISLENKMTTVCKLRIITDFDIET